MKDSQIVVWQSLAWPSMVAHSLYHAGHDLVGQGVAVGKTDQAIPFAYEYSVTLTSEWELKSVTITDRLKERTIALRHETGKWYDTASHKHLPEFDEVLFIDISISPFTNSLPIHRLVFPDDQPQTIDTVFFDENEFSLRKVQQKYSKIDASTYRYTDVELPDFTAELTVDEEGLIVNYEHLFKRIA